ncbi:MAG TPA: hypothetical protein VFH54_06150 [Mycobacteriales bacterium]|nr:hypothetical protein [Mycobacteriales bacterium]
MPIRFDTGDLKLVAAELRTAGNKVLAAEIRGAMRAEAKVAADKVAASAREQGLEKAADNVKTRVNFSPRSVRVSIFIPAKVVPYARPLEFGSQGRSNGGSGSGGVNRHPVYAAVGSDAYKDTKRWVDQPTRPFFMRALRLWSAATSVNVTAAATAVIRAAGFH